MSWFRRRPVTDAAVSQEGVIYEKILPDGRRVRLDGPDAVEADRAGVRAAPREYRGDYPQERTVIVERRGGFFRGLAVLLLFAAFIVAALIATGFWKADIRPGALPTIEVNGGALPKVDVDSKKVVVGTDKREIEVPTIGVTDGKPAEDSTADR